ncbi:metallophosphoesterase [Salsuginibacillus kocurii]|uniref:metallophosphoesterase n=1 Tax=Salsuginibacillus kocurii TaxID=427078 RepID=UPI00146EA27B|nr:metallophosphoesterase [Salsuginibacillus kocurii]
MFISDLHGKRLSPRFLQRIDENLDAVVVGGDLTEAGLKEEQVVKNLERLSTLAPLYFVWGNHDEYWGKEALARLLTHMGVRVLENQPAYIPSNTGAVQLLGLSLRESEEDPALISRAQQSFTIIAAHDPERLEPFLQQKTPGLYLSGHTHGGQIRLFGWGPRPKGKWEVIAGSPFLISNGYGTTKLPFRFGAPSECHVITICACEDERRR